MIDPTPHLERFESYENACREFRWRIPERFNIASAICRRHDDAVTRIAVNDVRPGGINTYTFGGLDFLSDKFARALSQSGVSQGDSVAVGVRPSVALVIAQLGVLKLGAVVVPFSLSWNEKRLEHTFDDSRTLAVVFDESDSDLVNAIAGHAPNLKLHFVVRDLRPQNTSSEFKDFWSEIDRSSSDFLSVEADALTPAFIFYVESQEEIVGIVHTHRSVIGQLASFEVFNDVGPEIEKVFWVGDDWCSPGALLGTLYPAWWYGCSVVAGATDEGGSLLGLLEQCDVTNVYLPAMKPALVESKTNTHPISDFKGRTVVAECGSSSQYCVNGDEGVTLNEVCGRAETGWIYGKCQRRFATTSGSVGRPVPGRIIEIVDEAGKSLAPGKTGRIAVHNSDPGLFIRYRRETARTAASFIGDWFLTGDLGYKSGDGELYTLPSPSVVGAC
jgi:acetyl-CoA synthetase